MEDDAMSISEGECTDSDPEGTLDSTNEFLEPLIAGQWTFKKWKMVDTEENLLCKRCSITFNTRFSFDLHMAGLRHHQTFSAADVGTSEELQSGRPSLASRTEILERKIDLFQQLTGTKPIKEQVHDVALESTPKKLRVSNMLERNVGLLQHLTSFNDDSMALPMDDSSAVSTSSQGKHSTVCSPISNSFESPHISGECTAKRNNMTNVVARNVSLFEKLSDRLAVYPYLDVPSDVRSESERVQEVLTNDIEIESASDRVKEALTNDLDLGSASDRVQEAITNDRDLGSESDVSAEAVSNKTGDNIGKMVDSCKVTPVECEKINEINDQEDKDTDNILVSAEDSLGKKVDTESNDAESNDIVSIDQTQDNMIQETNDSEEKTNLPPCFRNLPEPILGADYLCEYHFLNGNIERTCDLCEITVTESVEVHTKTAEHILRYLFYHEQEAYRLMSVAGRLADTSCIYQVAIAVEQKHGLHHQARVYQETDMKPVDADDAKSWTELKDEAVRPISVLTGHRMNLEYSCRHLASESSKPVNDLSTLLDSLALQSCLAQGKPPSLQSPVNRLNLISSIAKFVVKNDTDAEVSLQMANTLTLGVLSYRQQMLPGLKPNDRTKYESRLEKLIMEAEIVATKANRREIINEPVSSIPSVTSSLIEYKV